MQQLDDAKLVELTLGGSEEAFSELVNRYADPLTQLAFIKLGNFQDAQDIVQETLTAAYCQLPQLNSPAKFGSWLRGIVNNLCFKTLEGRQRKALLVERQAHLARPINTTPESTLIDKEKHNIIHQAFEVLSETEREVAVLHYLDNMKLADISTMLNRSLGTVKRELFEVRGKLRKELIEMAREEFAEYRLSEEDKKRLAKIARFPQLEPKIIIIRLEDKTSPIRKKNSLGSFLPLQVGAEMCHADYDHPGRKLTYMSHERVSGPEKVKGKECLVIDGLTFFPDERPEGKGLDYVVVEEDSSFHWAKRYSDYGKGKEMPLLTWDDPEWREEVSEPESFNLVPGTEVKRKNGYRFIIDANVFKVSIGKRIFKCLKRTVIEPLAKVEWSKTPVAGIMTEEYYDADGRLILWRRFNGEQWSEKDPKKKAATNIVSTGLIEKLAAGGVSQVDIDGHTYYHWYNQIPDYAIK